LLTVPSRSGTSAIPVEEWLQAAYRRCRLGLTTEAAETARFLADRRPDDLWLAFR
jgi:hypothetical protein